MKISNHSNDARPRDYVTLWSGVLVIIIVLAGLAAIIMILKFGRSSIGHSDLSEMRPTDERHGLSGLVAMHSHTAIPLI